MYNSVSIEQLGLIEDMFSFNLMYFKIGLDQ